MKNILSTLRANNLFNNLKTPQKKPHASKYEDLVQECQGRTLDYYDLNYNQEKEMKKDDFYCIDATSLDYPCVILVFGEGLKIEGSNATHNFGPYEDGFGFSGMYGKVTATVDTKARFFIQYVTSFSYKLDQTTDGIKQNAEVISVIVMKSEWEQTITFKGYNRTTSEEGYIEMFQISNPLTSDITITPGKEGDMLHYYYFTDQSEDFFEGNVREQWNAKATSLLAQPLAPEPAPEYFEVTADVRVKAVKTPEYYPEMVVLAEQNKIYYRGMEEFTDFEANKGLSAGAIAGIVIACVVVVGVIVFCIVWFVVLKKGCCCKSQKVAATSD